MGHTISVIIVDDNASFVRMLSQYFHHHTNFIIEGIAKDITEAYDLVLLKKPDVVLLDVQMPEAHALNLITSVDKLPKKPDFIIMGAAGVESVMQHAQTFGIVYCMIKPFCFKMAAERIHSLCGQTGHYEKYTDTKEEAATDTVLEARIMDFLYSMGLAPNIQGFLYLKDSILIASKLNRYEKPKASTIYMALASRYHTTPSCVERAIQYAKTLAAQKRKPMAENIFKHCASKRNRHLPTNMELIIAIADQVVLPPVEWA